MQGSSGMTAGLAGRYAAALFALAHDKGQLAAVGASLAKLGAALDASAEMRAMTVSPLVPRAEGERALLALADGLGLDRLTHDFLGVVARGRRMGSLPGDHRRVPRARGGRTRRDDRRGDERASADARTGDAPSKRRSRRSCAAMWTWC